MKAEQAVQNLRKVFDDDDDERRRSNELWEENARSIAEERRLADELNG